ncbi:MAG: hypothetical protein KDC38_11775 [Planctomycetes bacterium]|nr:hypothetical protein [Planctomycetota bacterium]
MSHESFATLQLLAVADDTWSVGDASISLSYAAVTLFCAASGVALCTMFARNRRLRDDRPARLAAALGAFCGIALYLVVLPPAALRTVTVACFTLAALSGHVLIGGYLGLRAIVQAIRTWRRDRFWGAQRGGWSRPRLFRLSAAAYQRLRSEHERELTFRPTDPQLRRELLEILLEVGDYEAASYHAYVLVELLPHGPIQGFALYRLCQVLVDKLNRLEEAQPHLRRIIRVYPRSFFASYARRLVSQYEAYADREL